MGNETGTRDSAKEELGWLKVVFAVAAAIDASLVAWLGQHHGHAEVLLLVLAFLAAGVLTAYVVRLNRVAYRRIHELKDL
jgi:4-hydroxybenzoate polyprenyltransferase